MVKVMKKIMIASDIHGSAYYCEKMLECYKNEKADMLVLLGDILYHGPRNDLPEDYAPKKVIAMLNPLKNYVNDRHLVLAHGHKLDEKNIPALRDGDYLVCGHTHIPAWEKRGTYTYVNPGSVSIPKENSEHGYIILSDKFYWKNLDGEVYKTEE